MSLPRVSVLMSVYNGGSFLSEAIESILNQSYNNLEFVIVDDGSSDNSWETLQSYAELDERIILLRNSPNMGVVRALNSGLDHTRAEFIARQDADDISHPDRLKRQIEFLDSHPDHGVVAAVPLLVAMDGTPLDRPQYTARENNDIQESLLDYMCLCGPTILMRRKCLEEAGYYFAEGSDASEDYDICLRLAEVTKLASLDGYLYQYRQQPDSASHQRAAQQMVHKAVALEKALARRYGAHPPKDKLGIVARDYLHAAILAYIKNNLDQARQSLGEALRVYPIVLERDQPLENLVSAYTPQVSFELAVAYVDGIFRELLPRTKFLSTMRSKLISNLHMSQVFDGASKENFTQVNQHLWYGIWYQPSWLLNQGIASIIYKLLLFRVNMIVRKW